MFCYQTCFIVFRVIISQVFQIVMQTWWKYELQNIPKNYAYVYLDKKSLSLFCLVMYITEELSFSQYVDFFSDDLLILAACYKTFEKMFSNMQNQKSPQNMQNAIKQHQP